MSDELIKLLADPKLSFTKKLWLAIQNDLDFWEGRTNKPNLTKGQFHKLIRYIPAGLQPKWVPRKSEEGPHGEKGEDYCFKFEFAFTGFGKRQIYFVKGYFFDKGNCRGVTIQSFRLENNVVQLPKIGK